MKLMCCSQCMILNPIKSLDIQILKELKDEVV